MPHLAPLSWLLAPLMLATFLMFFMSFHKHSYSPKMNKFNNLSIPILSLWLW